MKKEIMTTKCSKSEVAWSLYTVINDFFYFLGRSPNYFSHSPTHAIPVAHDKLKLGGVRRYSLSKKENYIKDSSFGKAKS